MFVSGEWLWDVVAFKATNNFNMIMQECEDENVKIQGSTAGIYM